MIHFSCDRCNRLLDPENDIRYVVRMEVRAVMDCADAGDIDEDRDYLLEIEEILERLSDEECDEIGDEVYHRRRYDLCADCRRKLMSNPLGKDTVSPIQFSPN